MTLRRGNNYPRVGNYKAVFNLRGDDGASTGGLAVDSNRDWKGSGEVGKLDKALDQATAKGWAVVDMKQDWKTIFPSAK
jgi:hypothetical protein